MRAKGLQLEFPREKPPAKGQRAKVTAVDTRSVGSTGPPKRVIAPVRRLLAGVASRPRIFKSTPFLGRRHKKRRWEEEEKGFCCFCRIDQKPKNPVNGLYNMEHNKIINSRPL